MSVIDFDKEENPFTPSGDLEDESKLNEVLMEEFDEKELDGKELNEDDDLEEKELEDIDDEIDNNYDDLEEFH